MAPGSIALANAAKALSSIVFDGKSSDEALAKFDASPHRSATRAITLGTVRWYLRLVPAVEALLARPRGVPNEIRALLAASAHQIEYSRNAPEATVDAAVDAARVLQHPGATGLINAVLRKFVKGHTSLLARTDQNVAARTAHPSWLVELFEKTWQEKSGPLLAADNLHPPMVLRINLSRRSVADYLAELASADITARAIPWSTSAVELDRPVGVSALPGFQDGVVSVQDAGAQLVPSLLDARPGMRVLDACAAPGGKTGHILESTPGLARLVAVDIDSGRVERIRENLDRLRVTADVMSADVRQPGAFWDGSAFDRILVDAPCSSTGVIRRHPDIKLLRRPGDVPAFARTQFDILRAAFGMLAPGGRLVYCTCSVLPAENDEVVARLLEAEASARALGTPPRAASEAVARDCVGYLGVAAEAPAWVGSPLVIPPGAVTTRFGLQLLPGAEAGSDGFYYACLEKTTAGVGAER